jgi:hypothetical protein
MSSCHSARCSCPDCAPTERWCVVDDKQIHSCQVLSRAFVERSRKKPLKDGRVWMRLEEVPQEMREAYLGKVYGTPAARDMEYLADCPFCGSIAVMTSGAFAEGVRRFFVICANPDCGCSLNPVLRESEAARLWNRRLIQFRAVVPSPG